jgi:hypothetical protein
MLRTWTGYEKRARFLSAEEAAGLNAQLPGRGAVSGRMVSRHRRATVRGALMCWLAVSCLVAGCETSEVNRNGEDAGSDAGQCIVDAGPPSDLQYCGGICYLELCCTDAHADCPDRMPAEGTCCSPSGISCAYGCGDGEWHQAICRGARGWEVGSGAHCDPPLDDGGAW